MRAQIAIPAGWMRGGVSEGLSVLGDVLPADRAARDRPLLRAIGGPDPFGGQRDGVGGATSSTRRVVVSPSARADCDVDCLFGAVAIDAPLTDDSESCGRLIAAVGPFAIEESLVASRERTAVVPIGQANAGKRILAQVPVRRSEPAVQGGATLTGCRLPARRSASSPRPRRRERGWPAHDRARPRRVRGARGRPHRGDAARRRQPGRVRACHGSRPHRDGDASRGRGGDHALLPRPAPPGTPFAIGHTSGRLEVGAVVAGGGAWRIGKTVMRRTARRLMTGARLVPQSALAG